MRGWAWENQRLCDGVKEGVAQKQDAGGLEGSLQGADDAASMGVHVQQGAGLERISNRALIFRLEYLRCHTTLHILRINDLCRGVSLSI